MSAIHELRDDFRHYRNEHSEYRLVFVLLDVVILALKMALFAGFVLLCWYLMGRGTPESGYIPANLEANVVVEPAEEVQPEPELTEERIALLNDIAGRPAEKSGEAATVGDVSLAGSVTPAVNAGTDPSDVARPVVVAQSSNSNAANDTFVTKTLEDQSIPKVIENSAGKIVTETSPARVVNVESSAGQSESGVQGAEWVFSQAPENFTVQIALTVNRPFLIRFVDQLPPEYASAVYPARMNDKGGLQYSLSFGSFADEAQAKVALAQLSEANKRYGAHIKQFDEIQQNVSGL